MNRLILLTVLCLSISGSYAGTFFGKCPQSPVMPFDPSRYLGTWYEIERFDYIFEADLECVKATYGAKADGTVSVRNEGFNT